MFRFLKSLFRKSPPTPSSIDASPVVVAQAPEVQTRPSEVTAPMQRVETAQLALGAIMSKFPDDLRRLVLKMPPADAMVVLPLPTIQKFLPTGSVKMSLASVVRQAPPGTFATINPQDKRMVEVPLAEIFKRINKTLLKKRSDQKANELAVDGFDIFGDEENPRSLAPRVEGKAAQEQPAVAAPVLGAPSAKALKVPPGVVTAPPPNVPVPAEVKAPPRAPKAPLGPKPQRTIAAPPDVPPIFARQDGPTGIDAPVALAEAPAAPTPVPAVDHSPLVIALNELLTNWPEPIKSEAVALNGATVSLPAADVSSGLAKGKVAFAWGQLREWMAPPPSTPSQGADSTELVLPLRVIAPAFLKHTKSGASARKAAEVGDIPELFAGGKAAPTKQAPPAPVEAKAPEPPPAVEPAPSPTPAPAEAESAPTPEAKDGPVEKAAVEPPVVEAVPEPAPEPVVEAPAAPTAEVSEQSAAASEVPEPAPAPAEPEVAVAAVAALPKSLGELFGEPDKTTWSPTEVVNHLTKLPDVTGALVALQEGLVIAHKLPEPLKGEIFAAFLPQIFARLNQYVGEMKLGAVEEVVVQAHGGTCHLFRRGQVYFAALSESGTALPMHNLRLCADAVAS